MISKGDGGYYHPTSEAEISDLIQYAGAHGLKIRVRGSGHSVKAAIYTGNFENPPHRDNDLNLYLDRMTQVTFDEARQQVTAQGGCHLGLDPMDPTHQSTRANSLFYQVDQKGWAFPTTGGISTQTVGGFMSTGSAGTSLHQAVGRQVLAIRLVDGLGNLQEYHKTDDLDDPFYAAGVSMGLLGVITSVTFQCVDRFAIVGMETTSSYQNCKIDLFGEGTIDKPSLETFLRDRPHARMMWFPQQHIERMIVWEADHLEPVPNDFTPKPYSEFPVVLGSEFPAQFAASILFKLFDLINPPEPSGSLGKWLRSVLKPIYPSVVNYFLASAVLGPQHFQDIWWAGVPMDDRVDYNLLPTEFTELWFPIEKTAEVMQEYLAYYQQGGWEATGIYTAELYCSPSSNFWMSPAYQQDVFRADQFWFARNRGVPDRDFYPPLWERMRKFNFRLHWGKYLYPDVAYLKQQYPRWDDFMALRAQLDPHQVFVTDYWRRHLGIEMN